MQNKKHVAILGGGPCGLYAGRILSQNGYQVTLLDKGQNPGGLARGYHFNDNWYDSGVHMFHSHEKEIFEDIKNIMGDERIEVQLNAKIRWAGNFYRYPLQFQDMIKGIPFFTLTYQVLGLFKAQIINYLKSQNPSNAEIALKQLYGNPLYEFFFRDFTHRYWGIHPRELSATFITTKMPRLSAVDVIKRGLAKIGIKEKAVAVESALREEILSYSRNGAEAMPRKIAETIRAANSTVIQDATVKKLLTHHNKITHIIYEHHQQQYQIVCDECISTIPITDLIQALSPLPPTEIINASKHLRYKPIAVYGLLVNKPKCLDALYIYYRDRIFHRVGEPKNAGLTVNPSNHTVLIVETTCEVGDPKWNGTAEIKQRIFADLEAENICKAEDIVEVNLIQNETGYPIFSLGFEPHLEKIKQYIKGFDNLQSAGRQGNFTYPNMHTAMRMGKEAAHHIMNKSPNIADSSKVDQVPELTTVVS